MAALAAPGLPGLKSTNQKEELVTAAAMAQSNAEANTPFCT